MAFLYSLVSSINNSFKGFVVLSSIMAIGYLPWIFTNFQTVTYLDFALLDIAILVTVYVTQRYFIKEKTIAYVYLIIGLSFNTFLALCMYLDTNILYNYTYWWFWRFYSSAVMLSDLCMIAVLIINRDFLGLIKLKRWFLQLAF
ncbi:hypothetical protein NQT63_07490 [Pseudoalteromonas agarivorans]|uniref:hypothetical protein n=1 Tax=Pseudoalteromonas agarivorans TaxID=176102 RepID=UPI002117CBC4|nr:hypothetical protein [Pseudoalteromonas agarivorans]MCQ8885521.1 hypothetical protein [Pseudoalteromonas agarivorans]